MEIKNKKTKRMIRMNELEYRRLKRNRQQLLKVRAYIKMAWQILNRID